MRQPRSCRSTRMTSNVSIMASAGLRTSPYKLNTGMPCTGSLKSGDSIMLSCLSPRRPCCGPNAALSLISGNFASASSECSSSRVTEAGWASSATRLPFSGRRRLASSISRSMPNFIELERKGARMVEVGFAGRVAQRPVREGAALLFDHDGEADRKRRIAIAFCEARQVGERIEVEPSAARLHCDLRVHRFIGERHALAVFAEGVG